MLVSEQRTHTPSPVLLLTMMSSGVEYPFGPLGSAVLALSPPSLLPPPAFTLWEPSEKETRP